MAPVILVFVIVQDTAVPSNTFAFQAGLGNSLFHTCKGTIILTAVFFTPSIFLRVWVKNSRWKNSQLLCQERGTSGPVCIPETSLATSLNGQL